MFRVWIRVRVRVRVRVRKVTRLGGSAEEPVQHGVQCLWSVLGLEPFNVVIFPLRPMRLFVVRLVAGRIRVRYAVVNHWSWG